MKLLILFFVRLYMSFFYLFRNRKKKQVFISALGHRYADNGRSVSEELHKIDPSITIVWDTTNSLSAPDYVKKARGQLAVKKAMAQSRVWVIDRSYFWKPKDIFSVAVWHGDRAFKRILNAANEPGLTNIGRTIDLFVSGSEFGEKMAHEAFLYNGEILKSGSPRNDKLLHLDLFREERNSIRETLGIKKEIKILLYAPTFRDNSNHRQQVDVDFNKVLSILESKGETWVCLFRAHVGSKGIDFEHTNKIIDVSDYEDMADLLLVTDFLITDYSSCACDFVLTSRPCVLVQFDRDVYESESRKFWFDPKESGFLIANNQEELNDIIINLDMYNFEEISKRINTFFGTYETGRASYLLSERIIAELEK